MRSTSRFLAVCVMLVLIASGAYALNPPKGVAWRDDLQTGKAEAAARRVPIMMYVAGDDPNSTTTSQSLQDPKIIRMLRNFACVFISKSHNQQKYQASYVPWIGVTPQTTHSPPVLIFGDPAGKVHQEYRKEGKPLKPAEVLAHLEKVLRSLAPKKARALRGETLKTMTLPEYCKRIEGSQAFIEESLSPEKVALVRMEAGAGLDTCKYLKKKLNKIKDKKKKAEAFKYSRILEKYLKKLVKYKGREKDQDKYEEYVEKAREALDDLKSVIESIKVETETLKYKAVPRRKGAGADDALRSDLEKLGHVTQVTFEKTEESAKVDGTELKVSVFTITCERDTVKKADIEKVFKKHGYEGLWIGTEK